jgi:hypothetical protein
LLLERSANRGPKGTLTGEEATAKAATAPTVMDCLKARVTAWEGYEGLNVTEQVSTIRETMTSLVRDGMEVVSDVAPPAAMSGNRAACDSAAR